MTTGQIVRKARKRKGLTVEQLANMTGVGRATIYNIEADKTSPRMDNMLAIMRVLDYEILFMKRYKGGYCDE